MKQKKINIYLKDRLHERSTWLGIIAVLDVCGVLISPEMANQIIGAGVILAGGVVATTPDSKQSGEESKG